MIKRIPMGLVLASFMISGAAHATYTVQSIGTLGGGYSIAMSINESGVVVGGSQTATQHFHGIRYANGQLTDIGTLGNPTSDQSFAVSINKDGSAVGESFNVDDWGRGFYTTGGPLVDLGAPHGSSSGAKAINDHGVIVGNATFAPNMNRPAVYVGGAWQQINGVSTWGVAENLNESGTIVGFANTTLDDFSPMRAFVYANGATQMLGTFGGANSIAYDVNESGVVVGTANDASSQPRAFMWAGGPLIDLGTLGGNNSDARAINDAGVVVGYANDKAFIFQDGMMTDLNSYLPVDSGWTLMGAQDINNHGQIVGYGLYNGEMRGFVMTPNADAPEPATLALVGVALAGFAVARRALPAR